MFIQGDSKIINVVGFFVFDDVVPKKLVDFIFLIDYLSNLSLKNEIKKATLFLRLGCGRV